MFNIYLIGCSRIERFLKHLNKRHNLPSQAISKDHCHLFEYLGLSHISLVVSAILNDGPVNLNLCQNKAYIFDIVPKERYICK